MFRNERRDESGWRADGLQSLHLFCSRRLTIAIAIALFTTPSCSWYTMATSGEESAGSASAASALFGGDGGDMAEGFRDKVASLHAHFDRDGDGFLNHSELRGLQLLTSDNDMDQGQYVMACKGLACDPNKGLCVNALKVVYASEGASIGMYDVCCCSFFCISLFYQCIYPHPSFLATTYQTN